MTGIFSIDMNRYFESSEGSYTNVDASRIK